ncbi:serum response factor-binding protein 1-like [Manis pentadactyla]|uniref:serum response factor-binding protein 1-like n=1 Tax=Manis pentadactyla TaxID=143292 RepID=UPI00255C669A|nr:serum response factor-binding protein 1-like [Manis pentadactyla]
MRKEAKRIRALVIRRFVRSVSRLKSEKGTEDALLKNQRQARSLEEIHAMKGLTLSHWCVVFRRFWTRLKNGWQMQLECPSFLQEFWIEDGSSAFS